MPDGAADCLCVRFSAAGELCGDLAVRYRLAVCNGEEDFPYFAAEGRAFRQKGRRKIGALSAEIQVEPFCCIFKNGQSPRLPQFR